MFEVPAMLERLDADIILRISQHLTFKDVYALSVTNKTLLSLTGSNDVWALSGQELVRRGVGLPTPGFQKPEDLPPGELRECVLRAHTLDWMWATKQSIEYEGYIEFDAPNLEVVDDNTNPFIVHTPTKAPILAPVTSDIIVIINDNDTYYAAWDVSGLYYTPKMIGATRLPPFHRLFGHGVDLRNSCAYFLTGPHQSKGEKLAASLLRINFSEYGEAFQNHNEAEAEIEADVTWETIGTYPSFTEKGFLRLSMGILDVEAKTLSIVFAKGCRIYLCVVLNWNLGIVALIDTEIDIPFSVTAYTYDCLLERRLGYGAIIMRWERRQHSHHGLEYKFKLDSLYPHAIHTSELTDERLDNIPIVKAESSASFPAPLGIPSHESDEYLVQVIPPSPYHIYLDTRPTKLASVIHSLKYPIGGFTHHFADFESEDIVEELHEYGIGNVARFSAQYGAAAWVERSGTDGGYELRVTRFALWNPPPCSTSNKMDEDEDEVMRDGDASEEVGEIFEQSEPCLLALPPGLGDRDGGLGFANIVLDNVHGRVYIAMPGGKIYVIAYI